MADDSRLQMANALRELADHSSEVELRNSLSRSYYSIYHAAKLLSAKIDHRNIAEELGKIETAVGLDVEILQKLRSQADYDPLFVERQYGGDSESFRLDVQVRTARGRAIFRWILDQIGKQS